VERARAKIEGLLRLKQFQRAEEAAIPAVYDHPTDARLHALLGLARFRQGKFAAALESFERAASLAPDDWQIQLKLAQTYDRLLRYEEALRAATDGLRLQPNEQRLELLVEGLSRLAKPERTDAWEQSVHLDHHRVILSEDH
jgi:Flp pilus assembly protein TadD